MKRSILLFSLLFCSVSAFCQYNEENYKQVKSMEMGGWDFAPSWYYYFFHKNYSGAKAKWKSRGFKSGWVVEFKESRSNVKRVMPVREQETAAQLLKREQVERERKEVQDMHDLEVKRSLERNVDLVYDSYKDDFLRLNQQILDGFSYILRESKYKLSSTITKLNNNLVIINDRIAYTHRTGVGYEVENAKREQSYLAAKQELEKLLRRTRQLALNVNVLY